MLTQMQWLEMAQALDQCNREMAAILHCPEKDISAALEKRRRLLRAAEDLSETELARLLHCPIHKTVKIRDKIVRTLREAQSVLLRFFEQHPEIQDRDKYADVQDNLF